MEKHLRQAGSMEWGDRDGHDVKEGWTTRSRQPLEQLQSPSQHVYIPPSRSGRMRTSRGGSVGRGASGTNHGSPASTIGHVIASVIGVTIVLLLVVGGLTAYNVYNSAKRVASEASNIMACVDKFETAVRDGNPQALRSAASDINGSAHGIQNELSSPWWVIASLVPVYGSDVKSAQTLADSMVDLSDNALSPLAYDSGVLSLSNLVSDSAINVDAISSLASTCQMAQPIVRRDAEAINALPDAHIEQFATVFRKVRGRLSSFDDALTKANRILPVLPDMLGAGGQTRRYLIVAQSNAELRPTGGLPGSWGLMEVTDGKIVLGKFSSPGTSRSSDGVVMSPDEVEVFADVYQDMQAERKPTNCNFNPNFPRTAEFLRGFWRNHAGDDVDGVIAIDPVFLQYVLAVTGGVTTSIGATIDGANAAKHLLNRVYWDVPLSEQDSYFNDVAGQVCTKIFSGMESSNIADLARAIGKGIDGGNVQVWMAEPGEQGVMRELHASGEVSSDPSHPVIGVYYYNYDHCKSDWYMSSDTSVGIARANDDGTVSYSVTTSITNSLTREILNSAPSYVNAADGTLSNEVILYAPAGGFISDINCTSDDLTFEFRSCSLDGFNVWSGLVFTRASGFSTIRYTVTVPKEAATVPTVRTTPMASASVSI